MVHVASRTLTSVFVQGSSSFFAPPSLKHGLCSRLCPPCCSWLRHAAGLASFRPLAGPEGCAHGVDARVLGATFAGLTPLAIEQPASAYDSVVAMLQSWLVGGISLVLIYGAALVAAVANPLTKRRLEVRGEVEAMKK